MRWKTKPAIRFLWFSVSFSGEIQNEKLILYTICDKHSTTEKRKLGFCFPVILIVMAWQRRSHARECFKLLISITLQLQIKCCGKWFDPKGISYLFSMIIWVRVAFTKTAVGGWCFDYSWAVVIFNFVCVKWTFSDRLFQAIEKNPIIWSKILFVMSSLQNSIYSSM